MVVVLIIIGVFFGNVIVVLVVEYFIGSFSFGLKVVLFLWGLGLGDEVIVVLVVCFFVLEFCGVILVGYWMKLVFLKIYVLVVIGWVFFL